MTLPRRGFLAGVLAGIASNILGILSFNLLEIADFRYIDFAAIYIYGRPSSSVAELVFAAFGQLFFSGLIGIGYALLFERYDREAPYFEGIVYSLTVWFTAYTISHLFQVPELAPIGFLTSLSNFVSAIVFGIVLVYSYKYLLDRRQVRQND